MPRHKTIGSCEVPDCNISTMHWHCCCPQSVYSIGMMNRAGLCVICGPLKRLLWFTCYMNARIWNNYLRAPLNIEKKINFDSAPKNVSSVILEPTSLVLLHMIWSFIQGHFFCVIRKMYVWQIDINFIVTAFVGWSVTSKLIWITHLLVMGWKWIKCLMIVCRFIGLSF